MYKQYLNFIPVNYVGSVDTVKDNSIKNNSVTEPEALKPVVMNGLDALANYNKTYVINSNNNDLRAFENVLNSENWVKQILPNKILITKKGEKNSIVYELLSDGSVICRNSLGCSKVIANANNCGKEFYNHILWKQGVNKEK